MNKIAYWCLFAYVWFLLMIPISLQHLSLLWIVPLVLYHTYSSIVSWDTPYERWFSL